MATSKLEMPALYGDVVTEGHAAICRTEGHATHRVDGEDTGSCPRCGEVKQTYPEGTGPISFRGIEQADSETVEREVTAWKLDGSRFISAQVAHRITADFTSACFLPDMPSVLNGYPVNAGWFLEVTLKGYAELVKWAERFDSVGNAQTLHLVALAAWIAHNSRGN